MKCLSFVLLIALASAAEWAVLLAGSSGYGNYRHQSDVAHMYGVLTDHKYDPDHIITIMYGDLPGNEANPFPGTIYNHPGNNQRNYQEGEPSDQGSVRGHSSRRRGDGCQDLWN